MIQSLLALHSIIKQNRLGLGAGSQIPGFNAVGPMVDLQIDALAVMGKYNLGDNFSILGGVKRSSVADATADIFKFPTFRCNSDRSI